MRTSWYSIYSWCFLHLSDDHVINPKMLIVFARQDNDGVCVWFFVWQKEDQSDRERWQHLADLADFALAMKVTLMNINYQSFNNFMLRIGMYGYLTHFCLCDVLWHGAWMKRKNFSIMETGGWALAVKTVNRATVIVINTVLKSHNEAQSGTYRPPPSWQRLIPSAYSKWILVTETCPPSWKLLT